MSLWKIDWKLVIWWLVCILVFGIGYAAGAYDGKHAADRWWQDGWETPALSGGKYSRLWFGANSMFEGAQVMESLQSSTLRCC